MLICRFQHCLGSFSMLTVEQCSVTGLFRNFSNHVFQKKKWNKWSNKANVAKNSGRGFCFLDNCIWIDCGKFSQLRIEYLLSIVNILINIPYLPNITVGCIFQLYFHETDEKILWKGCRIDCSSVWDPLACWLLNNVLKRGFQDIFLLTSFTIHNFGNTLALRFLFFLKCWKIEVDFRNGVKNSEIQFFVSYIIAFAMLVVTSYYPDENACYQQSMC